MLRLIRPLSFLRSPGYNYPLYCFRNMASENTGPAPAGTHKDPATGEMISKQSVIKFFFWKKKKVNWVDRWILIWRELKRREKQRAKDAAKASKAPVAAAVSTSTTAAAPAGPSEDDLNPNVSSKHETFFFQRNNSTTAILRIEKSSDLRAQGKPISQPIPSQIPCFEFFEVVCWDIRFGWEDTSWNQTRRCNRELGRSYS